MTTVHSTISGMINEFAPKKFALAVSMASPTLDKGVLKKVDAEGSEIPVLVMPDGLVSAAFVADGAELPDGAAQEPAKGLGKPKNVIATLKMGRNVGRAQTPDAERATYLDKYIDSGSRNGARLLCRGLFGGSVSPIAAVAFSANGGLGSTVELDFTDTSLFRVGQAVDYVDVSENKSYRLVVKSVTPKAVGGSSANVAGTVVFANAIRDRSANGQFVNSTNAEGGTAITVATDDLFALPGTYTSANFAAGYAGTATVSGSALTSFDAIAGSGASSDLYGIDAAETGFKGNFRSINGAYSQEAILGFLGHIRAHSTMGPNQVIMSPHLAAAHAASPGTHGSFAGVTGGLGGAGRIQVDGSADKYGNMAGLKVNGLPITEDPNVQADRAVLFNDETTLLYVWREMGVVDEWGGGLKLQDTHYGIEGQIAGEYELVAHERTDVGVFAGVTGL